MVQLPAQTIPCAATSFSHLRTATLWSCATYRSVTISPNQDICNGKHPDAL